MKTPDLNTKEEWIDEEIKKRKEVKNPDEIKIDIYNEINKKNLDFYNSLKEAIDKAFSLGVEDGKKQPNELIIESKRLAHAKEKLK